MRQPQARVMLILSNKELLCRYPASARVLCEANISHQLSISSLAFPTISLLNSKAIYVNSNKNQKPSFHRGLQPAAASTLTEILPLLNKD